LSPLDARAPRLRALEVLEPGPSTTVQDLGRPGSAHLGVGESGAADRAAHRLAQRLVGNPEGAAGLEVVLGGLRVRARGSLVVAAAGAPSVLRVGGRAVATRCPLVVPDGAVLELAAPPTGVRTLLAVRGGVRVPAVLGSRSTDVLAGLGPPAVARGDVLPVGAPDGTGCTAPAVDLAPPLRLDRGGPVVLRVVPGPREDWFAPDALGALASTSWTASSEGDRVGLRLAGEPLVRGRPGELPSEGVVRGSLQVPPSGLPTLLLADHPVTGGYPVVAVVVDEDVDRAAQLRPGDPVRFAVLPRPGHGAARARAGGAGPPTLGR